MLRQPWGRIIQTAIREPMMKHSPVEVQRMPVLVDFSIFPLDQGPSVSGFVAPVIGLIRDTGFPYRLSAMGTTVETEHLEDALNLISRAHQLLAGMGCERIFATVRIDTRTGPTGRLTSKVDAVRRHIGESEQ
jgi:uncharacterized protein (TIGR00106 family)